MAKFTPLTLELVEEGRFLRDADRQLRSLQADLLEFLSQFGDNAAKAKASLTLQIDLVVADPSDQAFVVKSKIKRALPGRPTFSSMAMGDTDPADGEGALFVRASGSGRDTPRQQVLSTEEGEQVDIETGEVKQS